MRSKKRFMRMIILPLLLGTAVFVQAQDGGNGNFSGEFLTGYRLVDVSGSETKYDQHINLDNGMRLFGLRINYEPLGMSKEFVDLLDVDARNLGGDPFETFRVNVRKYGTYNFNYDRRKSSYFYHDMLTEGHPDFHSFDFDRTQDRIGLDVQLNDAGRLHFGYNRYDKRGDSTTTLDISRDEFEFDKPINELKNDYILALDYRLHDKVTIMLEEKIRDYENTNSLFLPGASAGEDTEDTAMLNYFYWDQPYDFTSFAHTLRLNTRPSDRFILLAAATIENLDMNVDFAERSDGVSFTGAPLSTNLLGKGDITRDIQLYDVDLTYLLTDRLALISAFRYHDFSQDGDMTVDGEKNSAKWDYNIMGIDGGVQFQVSPALVVSGGLRYETRPVEHSLTAEGETDKETYPDTNLLGFFGTLNWRALEALRLTVDYQYGSADDPFTLTSPTDDHRLRVRAQYNMDSGVSLIGSYLLRSIKNDNSDWTSNQNQGNLQAAYHNEKLDCLLGYSLILVDREVDQQVNEGSFIFPVLYEGRTHMLNGHALWHLNERWGLGGDLNFYDNAETEPLTQTNIRGFVEVKVFDDYLINAGYRYVDFSEEDGLNDYTANIGELSIGYMW